MKRLTPIQTSYLSVFFIALGGMSASHAQEASNVPTPSQRPDILHVSPDYIEELKALHNIESPPTVADIDTAAPPPSQAEAKQHNNNKTVVYGSGSSEVTDINSKDIMDIINNTPNHKSDAPYPSRKPGALVSDIEPAAHNKAAPSKAAPTNEKTLVSFSIPPKEIKLDQSLQGFLETYALKLFNENPEMNMEIHAYATPVTGEKHSDVRISLARALEVRSFLINKNIAPGRLKLQPNGQDQDNSNDDRIDILFIQPK